MKISSWIIQSDSKVSGKIYTQKKDTKKSRHEYVKMKSGISVQENVEAPELEGAYKGISPRASGGSVNLPSPPRAPTAVNKYISTVLSHSAALGNQYRVQILAIHP
jgi:hypothetical protein